MRSGQLALEVCTILLVCGLVVAACSDTTTGGDPITCLPEDAGAAPLTATDAGEDGGAPGGPDGGQTPVQPAICAAPSGGVPTLTNAQIIQLLIVANEGAIGQAQLAKANATNADVKAYADLILADDTAAVQRLQVLAQNKLLTPTPSPLSEQLRLEALQKTSLLSTQSGATFDLGYVDSQVAMHAWLAFLEDVVLANQVSDPELAAELQAQRLEAQDHLARAEPFQSVLSP